MLKILAITPFFNRSGSEIALFNLLNSIKMDYEITIFTPNSNPELKVEIEDEINLVFPKNDIGRDFNLLKRIASKIRKPLIPLTLVDLWLVDKNYDIIFLNTLLTISHYQKSEIVGKKIILYVHETELMLVSLNENIFSQIIEDADLILCSSNYVKKYLEVCGRKGSIDVLFPSLDFSKFNIPITPSEIRKALGFKKSDFIWAMCGSPTVNKNPKMFIEAAQKICEKNESTKFLWIGTSGKNAYENFLKKYVKDVGLEDKILFLDRKTKDYYQYINEIDGFLLTSFSESFSLVALEAACFSKPVVSFPSGGVLEAVPENLLYVTNQFSVDELVVLMNEVMKIRTSNIRMEDIQEMLMMDINITSYNFTNILYDYSIL